MKRIVSCIIMTMLVLHAGAKKRNEASILTTLLLQMQERETIAPDSFFCDVQLLRQEISSQKDSTSKAVYKATLAHLFMLNQHKAQTAHRDTKSHPDSIQEWSSEEYQAHAAILYREALLDMELLHQTPTRQWKPLIQREHGEKTFGASMLAVIWQAMKNDFPTDWREQHQLPNYKEIIAFYQKKNLREASLRLRIDSIVEMLPWKEQEKALLVLANEYKDLKACANVYIHISDHYLSQKKIEILKDALIHYPHSHELKNALLHEQRPHLDYQFKEIYYPETEKPLVINGRNIKEITYQIYKLPNNFTNDDEKDLLKQVREQGKLLATYNHSISDTIPSETSFKDTLFWQTPPLGTYAFVMNGKSRIKLQEKITPLAQVFRTSRLDFFTLQQPNEKTKVFVVDAESGEPQKNVQVEIHERKQDGDFKLLNTGRTNAQGTLTITTEPGKHNYIKIFREEDNLLPNTYSLWYHFPANTQQRREIISIFTDRSIYRPGQTIHVGAIAYEQFGDSYQTIKRKEYELTYYDANRNKLATHKLKTDDFGTMQDSLHIPAESKPGNYRIQLGSSVQKNIRIEEYRRPTFHVKLNPVPSVSLPADSITISGKAITFNDIPLANARVVGRFFSSKTFWTKARENMGWNFLQDTLRTDNDGIFHVSIPIDTNTQDLAYGLRIHFQVDVLSNQGETQSADIDIPICTTPLQIRGVIPSQINKAQIGEWNLGLYSSTAQPVDGKINYQLILRGKEIISFTYPSGKPFSPQELSTLPSGKYDVKASAIVNGDTAAYDAKFLLFSMEDTKLPEPNPFTVYLPTNTFGPGCPAQVQIGSSLDDAWFFCNMTAESGVVKDTLIHLKDSVIVWDIPYRPEYESGVNLNIATYTKGDLLLSNQTLQLQQPSKTLTMHWDTFRDHLQPGQQEEWRLTLLLPDKKPAHTNVLLSMYDASLDEISPHKLSFHPSFSRVLPHQDYIRPHFSYSVNHYWLNMNIRLFKEKPFATSHFDEKYFNPFLFSTTRVTSAHGGKLLAGGLQKFSMNDFEGLSFKSAGDALQGRISGLDVSETAEVPQAMAVKAESIDEDEIENSEIESGFLRSNMNELAFFYPQLRTDSLGQACLSFTLPESLTSWHLTGFAHTSDLFTVDIDETVIAQKELMAELVLPRFLRHRDVAKFTSRIHNFTNALQSGKAKMLILDTETEKILNQEEVYFNLQAEQDTIYTFELSPTENISALTIRWIAEGENYSDGEQRMLPILSSKQEITETKAFSLINPQDKDFDINMLFANDDPNATNRQLHIEYTTHPIWLAIKSLPSLFVPDRKDVLSISSAYYATTLTKHILYNTPYSTTLIDSLQYSEQLSSDYRMSLLNSMYNLQQPDGSLAWYSGMQGNEYLTTEVAFLLSRLKGQHVEPDACTLLADDILQRGIHYLSDKVHKRILQHTKEKTLVSDDYRSLYYLYILGKSGVNLTEQMQQDAETLVNHWADKKLDSSAQEHALAAIVLQLWQKPKAAKAAMQKLLKLTTHPDGNYLSYPSGSFTSIDRKIENHVLVMESMHETGIGDINNMKEWLLKQKRTQKWDHPLQTANAVYALMLDEKAYANDRSNDYLKIKGIDNTKTVKTPTTDAGYLYESIDVQHPKRLTVSKHSGGSSWGAVYATYEMTIDSIRQNWQGLRIRRDINTDSPRVGDRVHIRYTLTADRDFDFVCLEAPRIAAAEPERQISSYQYQNGLGYYHTILDSGSEYYFDHMPRGTYVIEEDWILTQAGSFLTGSAKLKCCYAKEFQSNTSGERMKIQ